AKNFEEFISGLVDAAAFEPSEDDELEIDRGSAMPSELPSWIEEFAKRLGELTKPFVKDIRKLLADAKSDARVAAIFFEYDTDSLNIWAHAVDGELEPVGGVMRLPTKLQNEDLFPKSLEREYPTAKDFEEAIHQKKVIVETWVS